MAINGISPDLLRWRSLTWSNRLSHFQDGKTAILMWQVRRQWAKIFVVDGLRGQFKFVRGRRGKKKSNQQQGSKEREGKRQINFVYPFLQST